MSIFISLIVLAIGLILTFYTAPQQVHCNWLFGCQKTDEYYIYTYIGIGLILSGVSGIIGSLIKNNKPKPVTKVNQNFEEEIKEFIEKGKSGRNNNIPFCPQCNIQMKTATGNKDAKQGKRFYVCPNYKQCRQFFPMENNEDTVTEIGKVIPKPIELEYNSTRNKSVRRSPNLVLGMVGVLTGGCIAAGLMWLFFRGQTVPLGVLALIMGIGPAIGWAIGSSIKN